VLSLGGFSQGVSCLEAQGFVDIDFGSVLIERKFDRAKIEFGEIFDLHLRVHTMLFFRDTLKFGRASSYSTE